MTQYASANGYIFQRIKSLRLAVFLMEITVYVFGV